MRLLDDDPFGKHEIKHGWTITRMITWVFFFCSLIVIFVLFSNYKNTQTEADTSSVPEESKYVKIVEDDGLTSDELQIWDDLDSDSNEDETSDMTESESTDEVITDDTKKADTEEAIPAGYFRITLSDGYRETHRINKSLHLSTLEYDKFILDGKNSLYQFEDEQKSYIGIKVSSENAYIDFNKVKKDGYDFVIVYAGSRGYSSGQIVLDEYAKSHIRNASDAKLHIGMVFKSQAITVEEAVEEAYTIIELAGEYTISYPIAFEMDRIEDDDSRTKALSRIDRSNIAATFLSTLKQAGFNVCIYGDPEFLIDEVDLSLLQSYDIWLNQDGNREAEIPYRYTMWDFHQTSTVNGSRDPLELSISLINYSEK